MSRSKQEELSPSELWAALTTVPRPTRTVPFPRNKPDTNEPVGELVVWPLTQEEQMAANTAADRFAKELMKDPQKRDEANLGYHHTYTNEVAVQVLFRACRDAKNIERPAFPSPSLMRQRLTTDEIGVLFNQYCTIQAELGPIVAHMSKEETEALIVRLVEGGSAFPFDSLSWETQRALVSSLASQLVSCWTAMSSVGLLQDVTSIAKEYIALRAKRLSEETGDQESDEGDAGDEADVDN